jgi:uncharacterized protein (DUF58 family)
MTRNRIFYAALVALSAAFALFDNSRASYTMLYSMLMLPLASLALAIISLRSLDVSQMVDKDFILKGEETCYRVRLKNKAAIYNPGVFVSFPKTGFGMSSTARPASFPLAGKELKELVFTLSCKYRGVYDIGVESVQIRDFLGIFNLRRQSKSRMSVTVYPRIVEINDFPLSLSLMSQSFSRHAVREEDSSAVSDVRLYNTADSMKRIHWKLSAKRMELMVKNYETTALNSTSIFLDDRKLSLPPQEACEIEDKMVETAVAAACFCLKKRMPVTLHTRQSGIARAGGMHEFDNIYSVLAHSSFDGDSALAQTLTEFLGDQPTQSNAAVIASSLDAEILDIIGRAHQFGHHLVLACVGPPDGDEDSAAALEALSEMGVLCVMIRRGDDLADIF